MIIHSTEPDVIRNEISSYVKKAAAVYYEMRKTWSPRLWYQFKDAADVEREIFDLVNLCFDSKSPYVTYGKTKCHYASGTGVTVNMKISEFSPEDGIDYGRDYTDIDIEFTIIEDER